MACYYDDETVKNVDRAKVLESYGSLLMLPRILIDEMEHIMLRLMTIITIKTVNHENICCLNSALLMLLLARRRGHLGVLLTKIKELADSDRKFNLLAPANGLAIRGCDETVFGKNTNDSYGQINSSDLEITSNSSNLDDTRASDLVLSNNIAKSPERKDIQTISKASNVPLKDSEKVMINFRELLCFWKEYYLKRGRDRLSLEFSTHIPFKHWLYLVDILTTDDGTPTALLSQPIQLAKSCYNYPSRVHNSNCSEIINYYR
jgi:hypothetical protein